jgi:hypothetical protein
MLLICPFVIYLVRILSHPNSYAEISTMGAGLIASVSSDRGTDDDITLVKNLVTSYIKKPSCIILLTVACESELFPVKIIDMSSD